MGWNLILFYLEKKEHGMKASRTGGVLFYVKQHPGAKPEKLTFGCRFTQTSTGCQLAASLK
jgi:hypothetical protein